MNTENLEWKLMHDDAITSNDRKKMCEFILSNKKLSYGEKVKEFEKKWSEWQGCKYSVFVNSGSSANLLIVQAAHDLYGHGNWLAQSCTWATNVAPILQLKKDSSGVYLTDTDLSTLGPNIEQLKKYILDNKIKYIFLTHLLGIPSVSDILLDLCEKHNIILFEDCCESHGSTWKNKKVGTFGKASTFSFFYGHHITTIEGGMICTDDEELYHHLLLLRSHGLLRELPELEKQKRKVLDIDERFTFLCSGYNVRNTDLHAVLGIEQMKRLETAISIREKNFKYYLNKINRKKYISDFNSDGVSLFAFPIITKNKNIKNIIEILTSNKIDNRPLIAGNLFRHPMMKSVNTFRNDTISNFIHDNGLYVGNNEFITENDIDRLVNLLNNI